MDRVAQQKLTIGLVEDVEVKIAMGLASHLLWILLAACAPRGSVEFSPEAADTGSVQEIFVATNRLPIENREVLSRERSSSLRFFDFAVSVPPDRSPGSVVFPGNANLDPSKHFLTTSSVQIPDKTEFVRRINARLDEFLPSNREVTVFVHGYNTNFAEGLYRQAQISHDFGSKSVSVNFAWPSAATATQYATDRESALFVRDSLETILNALSRSRADRIVLVGHSMGAHIIMETVRQMEIRNDYTFFDHLASIVLLAPDIDLDVFLEQASAIKRRDIPIFVFTSGSDRALRFSSFIRGRTIRLGALRDPSVLGDLPVVLVDLSELSDGGDRLLHSKAANSPTMISIVNGMGTAGLEIFRQESRRPSIAEAGVIVVQGAGDALGGASRN